MKGSLPLSFLLGAWGLVPLLGSADISMGSSFETESKRSKKGRDPGLTPPSIYERRRAQEFEDGDRARRLRDVMTPIGPSKEEEGPMIGITDGNWRTERDAWIDQARQQDPATRDLSSRPTGGRTTENAPGIFDRNSVTSRPSSSTQDPRRTIAPEPGDGPAGDGSDFRPLEGLGNLASRMGEKTQQALSRPSRPSDAEEGSATVQAVAEPVMIGAPASSGSAESETPPLGTSVGAPEREPLFPRRKRDLGSLPAAEEELPSGTVPDSEPMSVGRPLALGEERFELQDVIGFGGGNEERSGKRFGLNLSRSSSERKSTPEPVPAGELAADSSLHVALGGARFFPYGQSSDRGQELSPGMIVRVTKPGKEWASVVLSDGQEGIMRTTGVRRALEQEVGGAAVPVAKPRATPDLNELVNAKSTPAAPRPRAAAPSVESFLPQIGTPTASEPASDLLGQGLLPPLED
ncbi:MAG: hypothetical protein AAF191_02265 [Verrucomicrobiota bacterium]